jgi:hypothetical protein
MVALLWKCDTLVQYAARWILSHCEVVRMKVQFDSDYSGGGGASTFFFTGE